MAIDFEKEGLLEGLDGPARDARLELLERLSEDGVPLEELREAAGEGRLPLVPVERVLQGEGERFTSDQVAERSDLPRPFLARLWRALGMALAEDGEPAYTEADVEAAKRVKAFREASLPDEQIMDLTRVMSRSMATVAAGVGSAFAETYAEAGANEHDLAIRYAEASRELVPMLGPTLEHILQTQQLNLIRQAAAANPGAGGVTGAQDMSIAFADLVGFTKLGERVAAAELGAVAERLEEMAAEVAEPPVRLVKTIGDAVMLASRGPEPVLQAVLRLVEAADQESQGFPQLRGGVASGEVLSRSGDYFGRPVNLASRITGIARPGSVLVTGEVNEALEDDDGFTWSFAGARRMKGVEGETKLFRARRAEAASPTEP